MFIHFVNTPCIFCTYYIIYMVYKHHVYLYNGHIHGWPKLHLDRKSPAPLNSCSDVRYSVTESWRWTNKSVYYYYYCIFYTPFMFVHCLCFRHLTMLSPSWIPSTRTRTRTVHSSCSSSETISLLVFTYYTFLLSISMRYYLH